MKKYIHNKMLHPATLLVFLIAVSCGKNGPGADAFGNFEADEVIVSAQLQGILTSLELDEGSVLKKGQLVGHIDSANLSIKKDQLLAQKTVIQARIKNLDAQLKVQEEQRINLVREVSRIEKLLKEEAATPQQYDDIQGKLKVLDTQTETLQSQKDIILAEGSVLAAQIDEINNQLEKCRVINPLEGTVLEKYVEANELVSPGKALFKIANIDIMELKVFVSGEQLPSIFIGDSVDVLIDNTDAGLQTLSGKVSWISSQVEFTPKIIQTREERINMVYAIKVRVNNDGRLKIGMPGEVMFKPKSKHGQD
jgi:HlyD family secretion protein